MKVLRAHAAAGSGAKFVAELGRWGASPLEDAGSLLHAAVQGGAAGADTTEGAEVVAAAILDRPEGAAVVDAPGPGGRTPLHAAVAAQRLGLCKLLVGRRADAAAKDAAGLTPLDLARKRR